MCKYLLCLLSYDMLYLLLNLTITGKTVSLHPVQLSYFSFACPLILSFLPFSIYFYYNENIFLFIFMRSIFSIHFMSLHTFIFLPYFYLPFTFFPSFLPSFLPFHFLSFDCYLLTYLPTSLSYFLPFFFSVIHVCK